MRTKNSLKHSYRGQVSKVAKVELRALNPKFHPGADPIEREANLRVILPTERDALDSMTRMLEKTYGATEDPAERQALALWKFQVAQGSVKDQINLDFMRGFYFWLLGRGSQEDHDKTLWGRGNVAVFNKQVAKYVDLFVDKRTEYIKKLLSLANNIPQTVNGYYLYYKVIIFLLFFFHLKFCFSTLCTESWSFHLQRTVPFRTT